MNTWKGLRAIGAAMLLVLVSSAGGFAQESTYDVVKKRGRLIAGVKYDFPPAGYVNKEGKVVGFDVDVARHLADKLGVEFETKQVTSQSRIPMLVNGNVDFIVNINPTRERARVIDFSMVYFKAGQAIMVRKDSGIKGIADLQAPRKTGTAQGATPGPAFLALQPKGEVVYFQEYPQAVLALKQGRIDAVTTTDLTLFEFAKDDPNLVVLLPPFIPDPWAIGVRHNDSKWRLFIDENIMGMWVNGTLARLYEKHFGRPITYTIEVWPDYYKK